MSSRNVDGYRKLMHFHEGCGQGSVLDERGGQGKALVSVEEIIYSHAVGIDSDNCAIRQWSGFQEHRKRLADLRTH